jgi:hypothetical protein
VLERIPWSQFILSGEQNSPSGVHGSPLVTLWPPLAQVQRTVSPSEILASLGLNVNPGPTCTSKIWPPGDRTPLTAGRPFWSTIWMAWAEILFCCVVARRLSPESACDKNTIANIAIGQQASRTTTVFDRFIVLLLPLSPRFGIVISFDSHSEPQLTLSASVWARWCAGTSAKTSRISRFEKL